VFSAATLLGLGIGDRKVEFATMGVDYLPSPRFIPVARSGRLEPRPW